MRFAPVVVLALALGGSTGAAEPCRVTAVLEGDAELVDTITTALTGRGIETRAAAECPAAKARIDRRGAAIVVSVEDPDGRRSERMLDDAAAAASLIESWARRDMNAALLLGWTYEAPPPPRSSRSRSSHHRPRARWAIPHDARRRRDVDRLRRIGVGRWQRRRVHSRLRGVHRRDRAVPERPR